MITMPDSTDSNNYTAGDKIKLTCSFQPQSVAVTEEVQTAFKYQWFDKYKDDEQPLDKEGKIIEFSDAKAAGEHKFKCMVTNKHLGEEWKVETFYHAVKFKGEALANCNKINVRVELRK